MPLDTQTFALTKYWAESGLRSIKLNASLFSSVNMREARIELIAGANQITAIKNWLITASLIEKQQGGTHGLTRFGKYFLENDPKFQKSATWWALHLLCCLSEDPFPYDTFFKSLDSEVRTLVGQTEVEKRVREKSEGKSQASVDTYLSGVLSMFHRDGPLEGLSLVETITPKRAETETSESRYWKLGKPNVPDGAILLGVALTRSRFYKTRTTIDFGELITAGLDHFLAIPPEELRSRLKNLARSGSGLNYSTNANLDSLSFDQDFVVDRLMLTFLQEGVDTWM